MSATTLVVCVLAFRVPQGAYSDPGWQLKAVQQKVQRESQSPNSLVSPDPKDLSSNVSGWISFWAPGTEFFAWPLMAAGFPPGSAVRIVASACIILGATGWAIWIGCFPLPRWTQVLLVLFLPWLQYAHNALFLYSAEALVFAAVPWALLAAFHLSRSRHTTIGQAAATGLLLGTLYLLKYSAVFVSLSALAFLLHYAFRSWRQQTSPERRRILLCAGVCVVAAAAPVVGLNLVNHLAGGSMNTATATARMHPRPETVLFALANPVLIMASADAPLRYLLLHPTTGWLRGGTELPLALVALPGGMVLLYLLLQHRPAHPAAALACVLFFFTFFSLIVLWTVTGISYEARHFAAAGLAILSYAVERGLALYSRTSARSVRFVLAACAICYIAIPACYGLAAAGGKFLRQSAQIPGPSQFYNPLLPGRDVGKAAALVSQGFNPATDIWYVTDPITAMELPGRVLMVHADFTASSQLRKDTFRTKHRLRVRLVLPAQFEANGKGEIIRTSFLGAGQWQACPTDGVTRCWFAWVDPPSPDRNAARLPASTSSLN